MVRSWSPPKHANFYEKALFVKPTWRPNLVAKCNSCVSFARYASIRTFDKPLSSVAGAL
jgi:hypothetical protein